jgi:hypothetical protein
MERDVRVTLRIIGKCLPSFPPPGYNTCPDVRLTDEQDAVWLISMWW